jgi:hypothetical protein
MAVSAVDITKYLRNMHFPAPKQEIIDYAKKQNATEEVIDALEKLPKQEYGTMSDLENEFGEAK